MDNPVGNTALQGLGGLTNVLSLVLAARHGQLPTVLAQRAKLMQDPEFREGLVGSPFTSAANGIFGGTAPRTITAQQTGPSMSPDANTVYPPSVYAGQQIPNPDPAAGQFKPNLPPLSPYAQVTRSLPLLRARNLDMRANAMQDEANFRAKMPGLYGSGPGTGDDAGGAGGIPTTIGGRPVRGVNYSGRGPTIQTGELPMVTIPAGGSVGYESIGDGPPRIVKRGPKDLKVIPSTANVPPGAADATGNIIATNVPGLQGQSLVDYQNLVGYSNTMADLADVSGETWNKYVGLGALPTRAKIKGKGIFGTEYPADYTDLQAKLNAVKTYPYVDGGKVLPAAEIKHIQGQFPTGEEASSPEARLRLLGGITRMKEKMNAFATEVAGRIDAASQKQLEDAYDRLLVAEKKLKATAATNTPTATTTTSTIPYGTETAPVAPGTNPAQLQNDLGTVYGPPRAVKPLARTRAVRR